MLDLALKEVLLPKLRSLQERLEQFAYDNAEVAMMCRTHGQSATPSTMGKEIANFAFRVRR